MGEVAALVREERVEERTIDERCGRIERALRVGGLERNELSMTSVDDAAEWRLTPLAATAPASATTAAMGRSQAMRRAACFLTVPPVES